MAILDVEITNLRNLEKVGLKLEKGINIVYGDNGSGKTSILEGLNLLSTGKSFRTSNIGKVIRKDQKDAIIVAEVETMQGPTLRIGMRRERSKTEARVNGKPENKQGEIARLLPLLTITPESHRLIESGPNWKRKFVDWGLFHVEQSFYSQWRDYKKCLQQRNLLLGELKKGTRKDAKLELESWDVQLAKLGVAIRDLSICYLEELEPIVVEIISDLSGNREVELFYKQGWPEGTELLEQISQHRDRDIRLGHTEYGIHRADLVIKQGGEDIRNKVSRGQQKLFIYALNLAQTELLKQKRNLDSTLLLDDLVAELDLKNTVRLLDLVQDRFTQVLVTTANRELIPQGIQNQSGMFHVEHGTVTKH